MRAVRGGKPEPGNWLLIGGAIVALGFVILSSALAGSQPYAAVGSADPGAAVRLGAPLLRLVSQVAATLCTGGLAFSACFTAASASGLVSADGYAALRNAGRWATVWFLTAAALVPFDAANTAGQPLSDVLRPANLLGLVDALEGPKAWLLTAGIALVVAIGCHTTLRWQPVVALLALAGFALLPPLATGHASSDAGHDLATAALMIHVPAAAVWMGVLFALIAQFRRSGALPEQLTRRYVHLAGACWLLVAASGIVVGGVLVPLDQLLTTTYSLILLAKMALLIILGVLARAWRRRSLRPVRLVCGEFALLLATMAVSVGLTHLAPAALIGRPVTGLETLLGYDLPGPPTLFTLVTAWRVDVFFAPLALVLAAVYLAAVRRLRRVGEAWPAGRTAAWSAGCLVLLVATSSGIGRYAPAMFSVHIASHMLIAMLAPMLLALGAPLSLARQALPAASRDAIPGPREWLATLSESPLVRVLTHPAVALALFAGAPFALYFTSVFDAAMRFHWAHQAITAFFLVIGYVFAWAVVGVDPLPRSLPTLARLGMLLAAMPFDAVLAASIMNTPRVIGNGPAGDMMYSALALPWVRDPLTDQWTAGVAALVIGEISLLVALAALMLRWSRIDDASGSYASFTAELLRQRR